jgi:hypothetical protein
MLPVPIIYFYFVDTRRIHESRGELQFVVLTSVLPSYRKKASESRGGREVVVCRLSFVNTSILQLW